MSEKSLKTASLIQMLGVAALLAIGWLNFSEQIGKLERRIAVLESDAKALAPLSNVMRGYQPGRATPHGYEAVQATGEPDVPEPGTDNAMAWCPADENGGAEWIELEYEPPAAATGIRIHASCGPGAVVRVLGGGRAGELQVLWAGDGVKEAVQSIALAAPMELERVRIELDTSKVAGWNQIDAVALIDASGESHWARTASSSSSWSNAAETR